MTVTGPPPAEEEPATLRAVGRPAAPTGAGQPGPDRAGADDVARRAAARRLDEVFGRSSEASSDERDPGRGEGFGEDWYRANRPPHHGG